MAHHQPAPVVPRDGEMLDLGKHARPRLVLLGVGGVGLLISIFLLFFAGHETREKFAYSWLFGFAYVFTLAIGGLFWLLLHHATNSGWGIAVRRIMEQLANMLPVVGVLGLPLLFSPTLQNALWDWMGTLRAAGGTREGLAAAHEVLLHHKYAYLNLEFWSGAVPGWGVRFVLYFVLLGFGAFWLRRYSLAQDKTGDVRPTFSARRFSCGWLPVFAVCVTFAAVDWFMTLNFTWFSTMWGVYIFAGSALASMAAIVITVTFLQRAGYLRAVVNAEHYHLQGKLMLAFVIFWAYITFSQFFLIWYANITEETAYFLIRNTGNWNTGAILTYLVCHFAVPFVLLLPAWVKRDPKYLAPLAGWVLFAHALDLYFVIIPERGPSIANAPAIAGAFWFDLIAFATILAVFVWCFITLLARHSLFACGDPRLHESLHVTN